MPPDADRAHERGAAPASSRTTRRRLASTRRAQVSCVAALSNGRVVSGSGDWTLKVWDVSSGECLRTLTGHTRGARRRRPVAPRGRSLLDAATAQVYSVAVLPHGRIVSGSYDHTLKVWVDSAKMAGLVALRRTPENYDWRLIGRLIAKFL